MKSEILLATLNEKVASLAQQLAPIARHPTLSPRFDRHLFTCRSTAINDYLQEVEHSLNTLRGAVKRRDSAKTAWLAEHLLHQIAALSREAATWQLRGHDSAHLKIGDLHQDLLKHQDYERRLLAMVRQREAMLKTVTGLAEQQQLQREYDALKQRLARCTTALERIERRLANHTR